MKEVGELAACARRGNAVRNRPQSSHPPRKESQTSILEREKNVERSNDMETLSADIDPGCSGSGNIRAGHERNRVVDEREADGEYIEEEAEKDDDEELIPDSQEYEEEDEDKIHYGDTDIEPEVRRRLFESQVEEEEADDLEDDEEENLNMINAAEYEGHSGVPALIDTPTSVHPVQRHQDEQMMEYDDIQKGRPGVDASVKSKGRRKMMMTESSGGNERVACEAHDVPSRNLEQTTSRNKQFHKTGKNFKKIATLNIDSQKTIHNGVYDRTKTNKVNNSESHSGHQARRHALKLRKVAGNADSQQGQSSKGGKRRGNNHHSGHDQQSDDISYKKRRVTNNGETRGVLSDEEGGSITGRFQDGQRKNGSRFSTPKSSILIAENGRSGSRLPGTDRRKLNESTVNVEMLKNDNSRISLLLNKYKMRLKEVGAENEYLKKHNSTLKMELKEANKQILDYRIEISGLKESENDVEKMKKVEEKYTRSKSGRRIYIKTCEPKFMSILKAVEDNMLRFVNLEVLELDEEINNGQNEVFKSWNGPRKEKCDEIGTMDFGNNEMYVASCPLWIVSKYQNYTPSRKTVNEVISMLSKRAMASDTGKMIDDAGEREECLQQISNDKAVIQNYNSKITNAIGVRKKAARNKFVELLGYSLFHTRTIPVSKMPSSIHSEYLKQRDDIISKLGNVAESSNKNLDWWRTIDANQLCLSTMEQQEDISGVVEDDILFRNKIGLSVYKAFTNSAKYCLAEDCDNSILFLARLDVWINQICMFFKNENHNRKAVQFQYVGEQSKLLPMAVQQILEKCRLCIEYTDPKELTSRMGMKQEEGDDVFNNDKRKITTVLKMPSNGKYYVTLHPDIFMNNISNKLGLVYDCYLGYFDGGMKIKELADDDDSLRFSTLEI